ncbi:nuclear transport factor 2 family protein [Cellulomonas sp. APG4]|uniref:nuclear transport factor 2 family protein n=1 Tax=Cellulomonas sp. APG4 TaxID=1538656 RepID=UPI00137A9D87|nr:nuclear transport factor 2 family protein [Cellulomonas sp. APG4]NCT89580.1 nuclear transport factor 2 family protein [Cellulomonas sp. APG4]
MGEVTELERAGWQALSTDGAAAHAFYDGLLDDDVTMLLPGGLVLTDRSEALRAMSGAPWDEHALADLREVHPTPDTALVTYAVTARRGDSPYAALVSSLYVRRTDGWRLTFHQQTPR